ncbi:MAG TPA: prepilin-type N-terminal cleavage/methylation domain-containing protein [Verrucomicrobiae bacterium]|jgi:prepilin-type N-terminal cleavage/methylation domain-containing protein|nr:prepilin-type N-terminal cleavage/methylation domain-containing protein [Verrucomicrobiae bacterium]
MNIKIQNRGGFTLIEVAVASAIAAMLFAGIFKGYNMIGRRVQFASYDLAANTTAMRQLEPLMNAQWVPSSGITTLFTPALTNTTATNLCLPSANGSVVTCTNYISVTQVSTNPPYAMIRVDCVWGFDSMGTFTNTVAVLRAP